MYKLFCLPKKPLIIGLLVILLAVMGNSIADYREYTATSALEEQYPQLYAEAVGSFVDGNEKTIYLTYDDGPSSNTIKILDVLKEKNVKATFFVIGKEDKISKEIYKRIVDEGHTIGVHTYSHRYDEIYLSVNNYLTDFCKIESLIYETTGIRPTIFRFPGGSMNSLVPSKEVHQNIINEITRRGYIYYDWNIVSGDDTATVYPKEILAKNVIDGADKISHQSPVVLFHDAPICKTTPDATAVVIDYFKDKGYTFASLTDQVKPIQFANKRYNNI